MNDEERMAHSKAPRVREVVGPVDQLITEV